MRMKWIFLFLTFFYVETQSWAQTPPNESAETLTPEIIDQKLGKQWKGLIYICQPFCKFISIRENATWNPPIAAVTGDLSQLKSISHTDPLYPLLVMREPVLPFVLAKASKEKTPQDRVIESPPSYAKMDFDWGFATYGGLHIYQSNWKSNTALQEDLSAEDMQYAALLMLQVMNGRPTKLGSLWILHQLDLQFELSPEYKSKEKALVVQNQIMSLSYQAWFPTPRFKIGPHITYENENWSVPTNTLQHFSFNRQSWVGGVSLLWNRWLVAFDTSLASQMSEQQPFRQEPFNLKWYRLKMQNCSANLSLFDISFGLCGGLSFLSDQQTAAFADNILIQGDSDLNRTDLGAFFLIRIGEDFYK